MPNSPRLAIGAREPYHPVGDWNGNAPTNWKDMDTRRFHTKLNRLPTGRPSTQMSSALSGPPGVMTVVSQ